MTHVSTTKHLVMGLVNIYDYINFTNAFTVRHTDHIYIVHT